MTQFSERQRAELRDAAARSRLEALVESRRLAESSKAARPGATMDGKRQAGDGLQRNTGAAVPQLAEPDVLLLPEAQEIIRRIGTAVDPDYPHRADHVKWVAAVVVKAKMQPTNAYARPTL